MLKPQIIHDHTSPITLFSWQKPFFSGNGCITTSSSSSSNNFGRKATSVKKTLKVNKIRNGLRDDDASRTRAPAVYNTKTVASTEKSTRVKAIVTVQSPTVEGVVANVGLGLTKGLDDITDVFVGGVQLELVAAELDNNEKPTLKALGKLSKNSMKEMVYEADFDISEEFGEVGAILFENEHHSEMFVKEIVLDGFLTGPVTFSCESWVATKSQAKGEKRIFFSTKSYVPSETPSGLKRYRKKEIENLRGDGTGERKTWDRIYDYDVYNDLGDPDSNPDLARPVLGGNKQYPYPRRCRTGRPKSKKDPLSESRSNNVYVPRDEQFSEIKGGTFTTTTAYSLLHVIAPALEGIIENRDQGFPYFTEIDSLFNEGIHIPSVNETLFDVIPNLLKAMADTGNHVLLFETPQFVDRDKFGWLRDVEFSRQTLAGLNPCCIELVKEWPLKSKLDPKVYGPAESAITTELVEQQIKGVFTVEEALKQKKLFMLDYHDILLPYVERVRKQEGTTLYGSRTLFYLTPDNTLTPVAIELVCPPIDGRPQYKEVFTPTWSSTRMWLWKLARAHVLAHDSGIHQLVSHWLRTHCCTEPYIIASHRQLSEMHPIYRLLHPHFRYTMEINALARQSLINAGGIIEQSFSPLKYSIELSSVAYDKLCQFDLQAMPADLIHSGMAEPDPTPEDPDNLKLTRYLKEWVTAYVKHYYPGPESIQSDEELQAWPTIARTTMPTEDQSKERWDLFMRRPEGELLSCFPSQFQECIILITAAGMCKNIRTCHFGTEFSKHFRKMAYSLYLPFIHRRRQRITLKAATLDATSTIRVEGCRSGAFNPDLNVAYPAAAPMPIERNSTSTSRSTARFSDPVVPVVGHRSKRCVPSLDLHLLQSGITGSVESYRFVFRSEEQSLFSTRVADQIHGAVAIADGRSPLR
ncbi:OLC1v1005835C1 [Oldenlandia corymbosa var. corymbosa]|uniref:Lipoxygenase n=1 Tax=Oldenlandia corymbosa var. corymbosa TaxID=529605 RepID=A0AAV1DFI1_OLDCO|nr:OLC1v1005835C1 [Oldenlandia corymbosa var. corymbosa]